MVKVIDSLTIFQESKYLTCYMHSPESVWENDIRKIFQDFEIHMDHPIQTRRPDLVLINKKKKLII